MSTTIRINSLTLDALPDDSDSFVIDGTGGTRRITLQKLKDNIIDDTQQASTKTYSSSNVETKLSALQSTLQSKISAVETQVAPLVYNNAGAHNAIYRGKSLGTSVTDAQWAAISAGTFEDMYIGDYWTINSKVYRIAAFDYYLNCGDTATTKHHVVLVPDASMYSAQMNTSNTTDGAYVGSAMYTANLATAKTTITTAFGEAHVLSHRIYLNNAVSSGRPSGGAWVDSTVDLMCEQMVYGSNIHAPMSYGSSIANFKVEKSQLPLFALNHSLIGIRVTWWLRDVVTAAYFATVDNYGYASYGNAGDPNGVRPAFCIS